MNDKCPKCGNYIGSNQRFCGICGSPRGVNCPECGQLIVPGTKCPNCARQRSAAIAKWICISACILVVLGGTVYSLISHDMNQFKHYKSNGKSIAAEMQNKQVGDVVEFGKYEQNNNMEDGREPLQWLVIGKGDDHVFLLSKSIIACKKMNEYYNGADWGDCSMRTWLNGTFADSAFTKDEQNKLIKTAVSDIGAQTDMVFLLSKDELDEYCPSDQKASVLTAYASQNASLQNRNSNVYWLRSRGSGEDTFMIVDASGNTITQGKSAYSKYGDFGVRPAISIRISSFEEKQADK